MILHDNKENKDKRQRWTNWVDRKNGECVGLVDFDRVAEVALRVLSFGSGEMSGTGNFRTK